MEAGGRLHRPCEPDPAPRAAAATTTRAAQPCTLIRGRGGAPFGRRLGAAPLSLRAGRASLRRGARRPPPSRAVPPSTPFPGGVARPRREWPPGHKRPARPARALAPRTAQAGVFAPREAAGWRGRGRRSVGPAGPTDRGPAQSEPAGAGGKHRVPAVWERGRPLDLPYANLLPRLGSGGLLLFKTKIIFNIGTK